MRLTFTTFRLTSVEILWNFITLALFKLDDINVDECVELLRRSPLLESLTLKKINRSSGIFPVSETSISCLHRHSLELARMGTVLLPSTTVNVRP